ncbi:hypothetical protein [Microbacterium indicum]|uniref:primosomal protein N' family DNA-binding protein n=1 Tax=Microbacterium indicum TaxID=358100 RepID=UPI000420D698|nr:hypothetical protein [Microbacterium indicum]
MTGDPAARPIARILVDSPLPQLDRLFDYEVPKEFAHLVAVGVRVRVPLRSAGRVLDGYVVELAEEEDPTRVLAEIEDVVSRAKVLPPRLHRLARAVADRAAGSAVDVLRLAMPRRMVRAEKTWLASDACDAPVVLGDERARAGEVLAAYPGLADALDASERVAVDAPPGVDDGLPAWTLLIAAAAAHTLAGGRSVVLAVPDHRDLDLVEERVARLVPRSAIVRIDAERPGPDRYAAYLRTLEPAPCVVIGNRSAVYAPVVDLGLTAIWDDGDSLYEEPLAPYAHARDVAVVRQSLDGGALMFGGHTRTSDVERYVAIGFVRDVPAARRLTARVVLGAPQDTPQTGRIPSAAFRAAREALEQGPVLVQVARPGYAPSLVCAECRSPARCTHCGGPLHAPARGATPVCAWCARSAAGWACRTCESTRVRLASSGSERTADELGRAFPGVRIIVADGAHPVREVPDEPALVVATRGAEPLAPRGYRMVLLLDGDRMLQAPELRVGENCLRWWSNAAALAAAGAPVHLVGVTGSVARALATGTHSAYAREQLAERRPLQMPPAVRVARVEGDAAVVEAALDRLRGEVDGLAADAVLGPVPADEQGRRRSRALVRFAYAQGPAVAGSLRAAVVQAAVANRSRKQPKGSGRSRPAPRTLSVRLDLVDPDL